MTLIKNLDGSSNADIIGNDTNPTLSVENTSTGIGLRAVGNSSSTANPALQAKFSANVAGATVAPLNLVASTASQAVFSISGVFLSSASFTVTMGSAFVIPVYHESAGVWGYLSAFKNVPA